jgi:hypothetical protein
VNGWFRLLGSVVVGGIAFLLYRATLLPGLDLGDTASFQAIAASSRLTPRDAYPLYFGIGKAFLRASSSEPAAALNLASAVLAAAAAGMVSWVGSQLGRSVACGITAGLLLATSYTFWSQAIIAEVYALHIFMMAASLAALLAWSARPALWRLGVFFGLYAVSFGNHLMMILLAPGFTLFLVLRARGVRPFIDLRVVGLALGLAALGAAQYWWNFSWIWNSPDRAGGLTDALIVFWHDVTKADWRESMMVGVHPVRLPERLALYWFDLRQQIGLVGVALVLPGALWLMARRPFHWTLVLGAFVPTFLFGLTYNVGDPHVFFLPSHMLVTLLAGCGLAPLIEAMRKAQDGRQKHLRIVTAVAVGLTFGYAGWRGLDTFPAVDKSGDLRAYTVFDRMTAGLTGENAVLASDLNWELHNGLVYYARHVRPGLRIFSAERTLPELREFVASNGREGRDVVLTPSAADKVRRAFPDLRIEPDPRTAVQSLAERVAGLPEGTVYVFASLAPHREHPVRQAQRDSVAGVLTDGRLASLPHSRYTVIAGVAGQMPELVAAARRPYRLKRRIGGIQLDIRMESWLPEETFRRSGFGQVVANRRQVLVMDRGLSFVALNPDGTIMAVEYEAGLYAPFQLYLVRLPRE